MSNKLTQEVLMEAVKKFKMSSPTDKTYYFFGNRERNLTGVTLEYVIEFFSGSPGVVVVDPNSEKMWCQGKPYVKEKETIDV